MLLVVYCRDDATDMAARSMVTMAAIYPKIGQAGFNPHHMKPDKLQLLRDASSLMVQIRRCRIKNFQELYGKADGEATNALKKEKKKKRALVSADKSVILGVEARALECKCYCDSLVADCSCQKIPTHPF